MRTWSNDEMMRSTNSNSIVMDLLLVGDTYGCDGDSARSSDRRRSVIIRSQKQYNDRLNESWRKSSMKYDGITSAAEGPLQCFQTHPVYEVI